MKIKALLAKADIYKSMMQLPELGMQLYKEVLQEQPENAEAKFGEMGVYFWQAKKGRR